MPDARPFAEVSGAVLKEIAQSLMTMKSQCSSLENSALAFMPLTDHPGTVDGLKQIAASARETGGEVTRLYQAIAREAGKV